MLLTEAGAGSVLDLTKVFVTLDASPTPTLSNPHDSSSTFPSTFTPQKEISAVELDAVNRTSMLR